ncbi:hypothetical protein SUDANB58_01984 [Streptomyces sp. enrichment culture]|uniref:hypothetical protein n=1 Tax=Streptomyces sp. enrichment culture TaxID=1795815 RepID=UPI003F56EBB3
MPEEQENGHRRAGRLYATLRVLRYLAQPGTVKPSERDDLKGKDSPGERIAALRQDVLADLFAATRKGDHAKAAGELFRAIPDLIPPQGALRHCIGEAEQKRFAEGYRAQLAELRGKHGGLLD